MATMTLPRVQTYRIYYNTGAAEEAGADGAVYCGAKKKHMAQWQYDLTALQTERAGRDIIITRATVSWQTSSTSTYDIRVQDARCYGRGAGVYLGDAKGTSTSSMQWISTSRAAPHDSITLIQNTINSGATAIYISCQNESTSSNVYGTCQYGTLTIEYDYATPLTVIEYLVADKTMIALGESVGVSASIRNITESEISAVQLQVVREVDGADVAIGDAVSVDVSIPAAETAQISQTLTIPAWANAARATQLYAKVTIVGADAEKAALCTALDVRYNPTIETFSVSRAAQHPIDGWIKSDNGVNTMTDLKIDLGSGASGFTLKVYYGTGEIDTSTAQSIDLTSRISDAIAGLTDATGLIEKPDGWALGNAWNFLLVLSDSYESAQRGAQIGIAFTNMHLAGLTTGGVRFGGYCERSTQGNPAFECDYPIYADGGIASMDYSTTETKMPYKWIDGKDVYRVVCTTADSSAWAGREVVFPAIADVETIISMTGIMQWTDGQVYQIPYTLPTDADHAIIAYFGNDKCPRVKLAQVFSYISRITLIVEYTKGE
nr:MAG TPA: hypothetical protein [Caudoviricetes sp.]